MNRSSYRRICRLPEFERWLCSQSCWRTEKKVNFNEQDYLAWLSERDQQHNMTKLITFLDWVTRRSRPGPLTLFLRGKVNPKDGPVRIVRQPAEREYLWFAVT